MFNIGDKIVYPIQGVGVIDLIEEREFKGEMQDFYKIHLISNSLKVMLPSNRVKDSNIRLLSDTSTVDKIFDNISYFASSAKNTTYANSKERITENTSKMKSGTLKDYMEVLFDLSHVKKEHTLNSSETQMLNNVRKLVIDEISIVKDISNNEAADMLDNSLKLA